MRKKISLILAALILLISCVTLFSCGDDEEDKTYTVTFMVDGAVYHTAEVREGEKVDVPDAPTKEGYTFDGWLVGEGTSWSEKNNVTGDMTLVAKWKKGEGSHTHVFNQKITVENYLKSKADCENSAVYYYSCACGEKGTTTFAHGNVGEHTPNESGYCAVCNIPLELGPAQDIIYEISNDGTYAIVTGYMGSPKMLEIADTYENLPVTSIESYAFQGCRSLASITIPSSVKDIGRAAFWGCTKLVEVINNSSLILTKESFENGMVAYYAIEIHTGESKIVNYDDYLFYTYDNENYLFDYVGNETALILPENYNGEDYQINKNTFWDFKNIKSIAIPGSVTKIGGSAFYGCSNLEDVYITDIVKWCSIDFEGYYSTPFYYAINLHLNEAIVTELELPGNVTSINDYAFCGCSSLTNVTIPDGVTNIGVSAFENCTSLTSIIIPDSVTSIETSAFENCVSLESAIIGRGVAVIGERTFARCSSLESITLPFIGNSAEQTNDVSTRFLGYVFGTSSYEGSIRQSLYYQDSITGDTIYVSFYIPSSLKYVTITGGDITRNAFSGCYNLISVTIPDSVTSIGDSAFSNCTSLTSITIPNSVTSIGNDAFWYCTSLTSVTIPNNVRSIGESAFGSCTSIEQIIIPDKVTSIGGYAFYNCTNLNSIIIGKGVEFIGEYAFYNTIALEEIRFNAIAMNNINYSYACFREAGKNGDGIKVIIGKDVTKIPNYLFYNVSISANAIEVVEFENGSVCKSIGEGAFNCTTLESIQIPESVTSIGDSAFSYCTSLTSVTIGDSVARIGNRAFYNCASLTSIIIPDSVTSIGDSAFSNCTSLTSITIPNSVTSIGEYAFYNCTNLEYNKYDNAFYLGNTNNPYVVIVKAERAATTIHNDTKIIYSGAFENCSYLTSISIPNGVRSVGSFAFSKCTGLTEITFPNSVTNIGDRVLMDCTHLTTINIPDSVTHIEYSSFWGCLSLSEIIVDDNNASYKSIDGTLYTKDGRTLIRYAPGKQSSIYTIPNSVTSIVGHAFDGCSNLTSVTIPDSVKTIGNYAFYGCSNLTSVTIPDSVTSIGEHPFYNCTSLIYNEYDNAYYLGNENNPYAVLVKAKSTDITSCTIHNDTKVIYSDAFHGCSSLTSIIIPDSVTSIGDYAFSGCSSLESITLPFVGGDAFATSTDSSTLFGYIFGQSSYTGGVATFQNYSSSVSATSYYIPSSLKSVTVTGGNILYGAFSGCTSLASVTIGDSVTSIGDWAFSGCTSLTSVTIGDSVTSIGDYTFYNCASLASVTIGDSVTSIGEYTFYSCSSLTSIIIPDGVTSIGEYTFYSCASLASVTIGDSVTSIGDSAFYYCTSLTSVTIGDSVARIGNRAFYGCSNLTSVTIPNSVTIICSYAFYDDSLTRSIKYRGTEEEWNAIYKGKLCTRSASITYNYEGE